MRRSVLIVLLVSALFFSCTTTNYTIHANYQLKTTNSNLKEIDVIRNGQIYTDEFVTIQPKLNQDKVVSLTITNHHDSTIRILWDEAAFVDGKSSSHRIMHAGTKEGDKEQIPYVIPSGSYMTTAVIPIDAGNVYLWKNDGQLYADQKQAQRVVDNHKSYSYTARLLFPLEIDGKKVDYMMNFEVDDWSVADVQVESEFSIAFILISAVVALGTLLTGI